MEEHKQLHTRQQWKDLGYRVPTKACPCDIDLYIVPGYRTVMRERHLFSFAQVKPVSQEEAQRRTAAAKKSVATRTQNMEESMATVKLTIVRGKTRKEIEALALSTHGGNYGGDPGPFHFSDKKAQDTIRHNLTNYEQQWEKINRGSTGSHAYLILRRRIDALVDEAYPEYALDATASEPVANPEAVL